MVSCAADVETVKARVAEGCAPSLLSPYCTYCCALLRRSVACGSWQNIRMAMGNGADPDAAKVHEDYQSAPAAHKNQQGPRNVSDPDLFEPRIR